MSILLLPNGANELKNVYKNIFTEGRCILIFSAYLTEWPTPDKLNNSCEEFRMIVGKDFDITRKAACHAVMRWLPRKFHDKFLVASKIEGFHPKAVFWKNLDGKYFSIVGSSNLSNAAFTTNHEANIVSKIDAKEFKAVVGWADEIAKRCERVDGGWLDSYREADLTRSVNTPRYRPTPETPIIDLPRPVSNNEVIKIQNFLERRRQIIQNFGNQRDKILNLFKICENNKKMAMGFYQQIGQYWSNEQESRIQGKGWERAGKNSNFQELAISFVKVVNATEQDRDRVVEEEINNLKNKKNPARKAFFSEILCQFFPELYWIDNAPVRNYIKAVKHLFHQESMDEGKKYIFTTEVLREALRQAPEYPAKNIAELDTIIWYYYQ